MSCRYTRVVATNGNEKMIEWRAGFFYCCNFVSDLIFSVGPHHFKTMFVLIGILTICSAGFNHLVAVVKMENWLISFNVYI